MNFAGSVGGDGSAGAVTVTEVGTIRTLGLGSDGIFAQSAGGKDFGGEVTVSLTGQHLRARTRAIGILAQSRGDKGAGNITVTVGSGGTVLGGPRRRRRGFLDGAQNSLTNSGTIATMDGVAGVAVGAGPAPTV